MSKHWRSKLFNQGMVHLSGFEYDQDGRPGVAIVCYGFVLIEMLEETTDIVTCFECIAWCARWRSEWI